VDRTELHKVALHELVVQSLTERRRTAFDNDTSGLESLDLRVGIALSATDDGA
jgi:hypothetical protein